MPSGRRSAKRPYGTEHVPIDSDRSRGGRRSESGPDGDWTVQQVGASDRAYRCPGCDQLVAPGTGHLVAWESGHYDALIRQQQMLQEDYWRENGFDPF